MGDVAKCSVGRADEYYNEDLLYRLFGINAELLIDHAWGFEPCTMADIKAYRPQNNSIVSGQVLHQPYTSDKARIVVREMAEMLALDLVDKRLVTDQIVLTVGYDMENLSAAGTGDYRGEITTDRYGRKIPKHAHGTENLKGQTSSGQLIVDAVLELYDRIINRKLLIRRISLSANHVIEEATARKEQSFEQLDLFTDYEALKKEQEAQKENRERERRLQEAMLNIKKRYGKNAVLKGTNLMEGATAVDRNKQIGGHKA